MSLAAFQLLAALVLGLAYGLLLARAGAGRRAALLGQALLIGAGAWAAEESCIRLYRFYGYTGGWTPMLGHVPLLVAAIWPMVILSAREVREALWPGGTIIKKTLVTGAIVFVDATLIETLAVAKGLWAWSEGGYLGVPLAGILGWVFYAMAAEAWLLATDRRPAGHRLLLPLVATGATHALLVASWWGGLRWALRGDLGPAAVWAFAALAAAASVAVLRVRPRRRLPSLTTCARVVAASLFVVLLVEQLADQGGHLLLAHTALVACPYLLAVRWPRGG